MFPSADSTATAAIISAGSWRSTPPIIPRNASDSEEVLRVKGLAEFTRDAASVFVPTEWQGWDRPTGDLDFGASTPAFVPLPAGSNPPSLLIAPAKAGRVFVLNAPT